MDAGMRLLPSTPPSILPPTSTEDAKNCSVSLSFGQTPRLPAASTLAAAANTVLHIALPQSTWYWCPGTGASTPAPEFAAGPGQNQRYQHDPWQLWHTGRSQGGVSSSPRQQQLQSLPAGGAPDPAWDPRFNHQFCSPVHSTSGSRVGTTPAAAEHQAQQAQQVLLRVVAVGSAGGGGGGGVSGTCGPPSNPERALLWAQPGMLLR